tara:strand:- start:3183 stop:3413 length:231 start_codon:yes stop_codon:yes gene_type:complete
MTTSTNDKFKDVSDEKIADLFLQGIQVYEDQIELMDYVRKKSIEVRNDLVELEEELVKRKIEIEVTEEPPEAEEEK